MENKGENVYCLSCAFSNFNSNTLLTTSGIT